MNIQSFKLAVVSAVLVLSVTAQSKEVIGVVPGGGNNGNGNAGKLQNPHLNTLSGDCEPATAQTDLDVNNVRAKIFNAGDMWWDQPNNFPKYEIPKGSGKMALFAACIWIGGLDPGGQLKVAAMTYRQSGNDFWPGPLDVTNASIDKATCKLFDKHFVMNRADVEKFSAGVIAATPAILSWPGNGDLAKNNDPYLAPFYDKNGDGIYDPNDGDYPGYDLQNISTSVTCNNYIYGDKTLWWVFNDKGNIHTESTGEQIGLEIRAQAFGFQTSDDINNMTFYKYQVINRSSLTLTNTYFGWWTDADLGDASDDFVGCDVGRGLGYIYNGDASDGNGSGQTYGINPPAAGLDFFQGPLADHLDGLDNDRDGLVDEDDDSVVPGFQDEQIIMSKFLYYNNTGGTQGNPFSASNYYNYLRGYWLDNTPMTYGGTGKSGSSATDFMFSENTDNAFLADPAFPWTEASSGNTYGDRRFVQSSGVFTLKPGAVNYVTTGAVYARTSQGGPFQSVKLLKDADDKAQSLFDNCFKILNGPDAPDVTFQELDKELLFALTNKKTAALTNNVNELYNELDPLIPQQVVSSSDIQVFVPVPLSERYYRFQGYQVFQLKNATVSATELDNIDLARLVFQCDKKDGVTQLVNYIFDPALGGSIPKEKVSGGDEGIKHSFKITEDLFAQGTPRLVNHKTYHYMAVSYAYNGYKKYDQGNPLALDGQKLPYKPGRRNVKVYSCIPHIPGPEAGGSGIQSLYGMGPNIKRIEGQGNGGNVLDFTKETVDEILANGKSINPVYEKSHGPVNIKVIDPLNVPDAEFEIKLIAVPNQAANNKSKELDTCMWVITNITSGTVVNSDMGIKVGNEQILSDWGLSITIEQWLDFNTNCFNKTPPNPVLSSDFIFSNPDKLWLFGMPDIDGNSSFNWIRSGTHMIADPQRTTAPFYLDQFTTCDAVNTSIDANQYFEGIASGIVAPYKCTASELETDGPAWSDAQVMAINPNNSGTVQNKIININSVDIVVTSDKSKWTRCPVIETCEYPTQSEGAAKKMDLRKGKSLGKDGLDDGSGNGMSWFPGYAVNLETGERLNMAFGEDSWLSSENGRDMKWNPTGNTTTNLGQVLLGGKHYVYVFGHNGNDADDMPAYDAGQYLYNQLSLGTDIGRRSVYKDAMWVYLPLTDSRLDFLACDVTIKVRIGKPYEKFYAGQAYQIPGQDISFDPSNPQAASPRNDNNPLYYFSTKDLMTIKGDKLTAENALQLINVVPNPYYAYSAYEVDQVDNRVKVVNLPDVCTVDIYTVNGKLIRSFSKDEAKTSLDWDLKNQAGVPIGSGLYIIHVKVPDVGEKTIKWFGAMRPVDLDSY